MNSDKTKAVYILNPKNPYGFKVNINHPFAAKQYKAFREFKQIGRHDMTDTLRLEFEKQLIHSRCFKRFLAMERQLYGAGFDYMIRQSLGNDYFNKWKKQYA